METKVKTKEDDDDAGSDDDSDDGKAKRGEHDDLVRRVRFNLESHGYNMLHQLLRQAHDFHSHVMRYPLHLQKSKEC